MVPPRERDFVNYSHVNHYYSPGYHYFGYRVRRIPSRALIVHCHGVSYYCYEGIYYRPYGTYYMVCRPPFETLIARSMITHAELSLIRFSYYNTVASTYRTITENNRYIAEQNAIIAQNNAVIAQQNAAIAAQANQKYSDGRYYADVAYNFADRNGLVQSYAYANAEYYYQDGVFYVVDGDNYKVIIPPAGALVEYLPEDYEIVTLADGKEYYKVDDTVYKITIEQGNAYFEVMGQLYK